MLRSLSENATRVVLSESGLASRDSRNAEAQKFTASLLVAACRCTCADGSRGRIEPHLKPILVEWIVERVPCDERGCELPHLLPVGNLSVQAGAQIEAVNLLVRVTKNMRNQIERVRAVATERRDFDDVERLNFFEQLQIRCDPLPFLRSQRLGLEPVFGHHHTEDETKNAGKKQQVPGGLPLFHLLPLFLSLNVQPRTFCS